MKAYFSPNRTKVGELEAECEESGRIPNWQWDYVFVLPNPDYGDGKKVNKQKLITKEDAMERLKTCFIKQEFENEHVIKCFRSAEVKAFQETLDKLEVVKTGKNGESFVKVNRGGRLKRLDSNLEGLQSKDKKKKKEAKFQEATYQRWGDTSNNLAEF